MTGKQIYQPIERMNTTKNGSKISNKHIPSCCRVVQGRVICMNNKCSAKEQCGFC